MEKINGICNQNLCVLLCKMLHGLKLNAVSIWQAREFKMYSKALRLGSIIKSFIKTLLILLAITGSLEPVQCQEQPVLPSSDATQTNQKETRTRSRAVSPVSLVAMLTQDDMGQPLKFPSTVFFDPMMEELYVVSGGKSRIIIYGPDYFPRVSFGAGRDIEAPKGVYVDREGKIYVCQGKTARKPPRITVMNPALFTIREITFGNIEGAEEFVPRRLVKGINNALYVAGTNAEGVLVLDENGKFLRRLSPIDKVWRGQAEASREVLSQMLQSRTKAQRHGSSELSGLPPELIPKQKTPVAQEDQPFKMAPVKIIDVATDPQGHLYLLSEETSKVYVYSPDEELLFSFGEKGGSSGKMSRPRGVAVDIKGKSIYVVDYMRHAVLVFDLAGRFIFEFGGLGWGPGWFNYPSDIAIDREGNLIIADLFNQRVQILKAKFERHFFMFSPKVAEPKGHQFPKPKGLKAMPEQQQERDDAQVPKDTAIPKQSE